MSIVKPLEWIYTNNSFPAVWCSNTVLGVYAIEEASGGDQLSFDLLTNHRWISNHESADKAKDAAFEHYASRILSALDPSQHSDKE